MEWRKIREEGERGLSAYAARSAMSKGRLQAEERCPIRTEFERDHNRILYSVDFRRLRHKTQVFFNAKNDHICTRMEHVLYVGAIARTIARSLNLNEDLAYAIALGHDLGHAPFGHTGERVLDKCVKRIDAGLGFEHEIHSLRVVDRLATRRISYDWGANAEDADANPYENAGGRGAHGETGGSAYGESGRGEYGEAGCADSGGPKGGSARRNSGAHGETGGRDSRKPGAAPPARKGLNLTFEVRDGIACHCGERYDEYSVSPDYAKKPESLAGADVRHQAPATLEGCVVRMVDKIAYVGRDIEDALRTGIIGVGDISKDVLGELGFTNGQIINALVSDLIENSYEKGHITLSAHKGEALESLINENVRTIYKSDRIAEYERSMSNTMEGLFNGLNYALQKGEDALQSAEERVFRLFAAYISEQGYGPSESPAQRILDFVAGMTDNFALQCYEELYWM